MVVAEPKPQQTDPSAGDTTLRCPNCKRAMTPLFFSAACDFCDGLVQPTYYSGFVIYRGARDGHLHEEYVFRHALDAERWRKLMGLGDHEIREVQSERPFRWRRSTGSVKGLELADHLYSIFPDRCYEPGGFRAHVV